MMAGFSLSALTVFLRHSVHLVNVKCMPSLRHFCWDVSVHKCAQMEEFQCGKK